MLGMSRSIAFFPMICGSGRTKSRLEKAAGAETPGQMRNEKLHAALARSTFSSQNAQNTTFSDHFWKLKNGTLLWRETHLQLKVYKTHHAWTSFGNANVTKWREVHL